MQQNVVLIVVDALRNDRIGATARGGEGSLTPNIDKLAQKGTVFKNAFSCTNATDPSITSIHSGHDPSTVIKHHGRYVTDVEKRQAEAVTTVPEHLQQSDISTIATGRLLSRWHKSGFDHYPEPTLSRNRRRTIGQFLNKIHPKIRSLTGQVYDYISGTFESEGAKNEIDTLVELLDEQRFYGFIHLMDTHAPYEPDEELVDELLEKREYTHQSLERFFKEHNDNDYVRDFIKEHATSADYQYGLGRLIAKYDAAVVEADKKIGQLINKLRRRGRYEETTLIITSDHGESLDEHGIYFDHHGLYDESIHVPLIITGPEVVNRERDEFVQLYDLAPTIIQLLALILMFQERGEI